MSDSHGEHVAMAALLDGLIEGAHRPRESMQDWAAYLETAVPSPVTARFLVQLGAEWFAAPAPDGLCTHVADLVQRRVNRWDLAGSHLWAHTLRVTGVMLALVDEADTDPALAYLAAVCHDVAKLDEPETGIRHEDAAADFVADVLSGELPTRAITAIQVAIQKEASTTLGNMLHDADKLDKIGAAGIARRVAMHADSGDLRAALGRVREDAASFPDMRFDGSHALASRKDAFLNWFMPLAWAVLDDES